MPDRDGRAHDEHRPTAGAVALDSAAGRWLLLATVLGSGMAFLDSTVVNVALPAIGNDLGADVGGLQWVLTGYLVTLAALILVGGSLGDHYGRRRVFVIGVSVFAGASLLSALAPSIVFLIAARLLQGVGGALLTPGSLAIIEASYAPSDRAAAIGAWSGLSGVATAVGPLLGGWLVDAASWRWIFLINLPIAVVTVVVALRHVPESSDPDPPEFDPAGALTAMSGLGATTWALIAAGERGVTAPEVLVVGAAGLLLLAAFVVIEHTSDHPMLPPSIFGIEQFTAANLVTVAVYAALGASTFLLIVHLQQVLGYSALQAGLAVLPITLLLLVLSTPSGALAQRIGPRLQMTVGPLLAAAGLALMVRIGPGDGYVATVLPGVGLLGLGLAATVAPLTASVLAAVPDRQAGLASGVNNATARTSQLAAIALVPVVAGITGEAYRDPQVFTAGFENAMWITAAVAAAGGIVGLLTVRNPLEDEEDDEEPRGAPPRPRLHCAVDGPPLGPRRSTSGGDSVPSDTSRP